MPSAGAFLAAKFGHPRNLEAATNPLSLPVAASTDSLAGPRRKRYWCAFPFTNLVNAFRICKVWRLEGGPSPEAAVLPPKPPTLLKAFSPIEPYQMEALNIVFGLLCCFPWRQRIYWFLFHGAESLPPQKTNALGQGHR
jgi:hypothetical protein